MKYASHKQGLLLDKLSDKYMTDEETDVENSGSGFIQRTPKWRSDKLSRLLSKLDEKYYKSSKTEKARPAKPRRPGPYSDRMPPVNAPKWALCGQPSSEEFEDTDDHEPQSQDSGNDDSTQASTSTMVRSHSPIDGISNTNSDYQSDIDDDDDDDDDSQWLFNVAGIERP